MSEEERRALARKVLADQYEEDDMLPVAEMLRAGGDGQMPTQTALKAMLAFERLAFQRPVDAGDEPTELERGKDELRRLMDSIWRAEFRKDAPNWKPLPDLAGMVSQIDNMYAGVRGQRDQALWNLAAASPSLPVGETGLGGYPDVEALANGWSVKGCTVNNEPTKPHFISHPVRGGEALRDDEPQPTAGQTFTDDVSCWDAEAETAGRKQ